jgi:hypothetical protein
VAIEEVRGVFANVGAAERCIGLFPFEGIKAIHKRISCLGFDDGFSREAADVARREIEEGWKEHRWRFLTELERGAPVQPDSPYLK